MIDPCRELKPALPDPEPVLRRTRKSAGCGTAPGRVGAGPSATGPGTPEQEGTTERSGIWI